MAKKTLCVVKPEIMVALVLDLCLWIQLPFNTVDMVKSATVSCAKLILFVMSVGELTWLFTSEYNVNS